MIELCRGRNPFVPAAGHDHQGIGPGHGGSGNDKGFKQGRLDNQEKSKEKETGNQAGKKTKQKGKHHPCCAHRAAAGPH